MIDRFLEKIEDGKKISINRKSFHNQNIQENKESEVKKRTIFEPLSLNFKQEEQVKKKETKEIKEEVNKINQLYSFDKLIEKSLNYYIKYFNKQMFTRIIDGYLYFITYIPEILIEIEKFKNGLDNAIEQAGWKIEYQDKIDRDIGKGIKQNLIKIKISCILIEVEEDREEIVDDIAEDMNENKNNREYKSLKMMNSIELEKYMQRIERNWKKDKEGTKYND